ncbi:hypothetical protein T11_18162 [Trichinella zimbabwensis]|uniref:Uncharacterized protein n=1 Tax=Trichinella zimbabwensis TaxID=268475 RepID=A0A0V1H861_9BILA|nr:hypothetical protein T11_18162 [Trichinella zimbabwensis]
MCVLLKASPDGIDGLALFVINRRFWSTNVMISHGLPYFTRTFAFIRVYCAVAIIANLNSCEC